MPDASPETSRAIVKIIEEESAAFRSKDFLGPDHEAGGMPWGAQRTRVA